MYINIRTIVRFISVVVAVATMIVLSLFISRSVGENVCTGVNIYIHDSSEVTFISQNEIAALVKKSTHNPVGKKMEEVNTEALEIEMHKNPMIKRIECYKTIDHRVAVKIYQRVPILRVMSTNGNFYVDSESEIMPVSIRYSVNVPLASGFVPKEFAQKELYEFACFLHEHPFWNAFVGQIYVYPNKEVSLIPRVGDQEILLGELQHYAEKLDKLLTVYEEGFSELGWNRYSMINLKFDNQVICTKK